jgi:hypothetical protein
MTLIQLKNLVQFIEEFEHLTDSEGFYLRFKKFVDTLANEDKVLAHRALLDTTIETIRGLDTVNFGVEEQADLELEILKIENRRKAA